MHASTHERVASTDKVSPRRRRLAVLT